MSENNENGRSVISLVVVGLLAISLVANLVLVSMYMGAKSKLSQAESDPNVLVEKEIDELIELVSKKIDLPSDSRPTLATVANAESLKTRQPFFANAENGDKVLIYASASIPAERKAFLYRPSSDQLINVAPVNVGGEFQVSEDEYSLVILNATSEPGMEDQMVEIIDKTYPNATVTLATEAVNKDYQESMLVRVGASEELVNKVASTFGLKIVEMPTGEEDPGDVDLVIILGGPAKSGE